MTTLDALKNRFDLHRHDPHSLLVIATRMAARVIDDGKPASHPGATIDERDLARRVGDASLVVAKEIEGEDPEVLEIIMQDDVTAQIAAGATVMALCLLTEVKPAEAAPIVTG